MRVMTDLEHKIVAIAKELGCVAELCHFVDYDPDVGRVPEHFQPRGDVLRLVERLMSAQPVAAPSVPSTSEVIEQIAQQWDDCKYDAPGGEIDIGEAIRAAGFGFANALPRSKGPSA